MSDLVGGLLLCLLALVLGADLVRIWFKTKPDRDFWTKWKARIRVAECIADEDKREAKVGYLNRRALRAWERRRAR